MQGSSARGFSKFSTPFLSKTGKAGFFFSLKIPRSVVSETRTVCESSLVRTSRNVDNTSEAFFCKAKGLN